MGTWLNRNTKKLVKSVSPTEMTNRFADFPADWISQPDLSAVEGQPSIYWLITGDVVTLMDQTARDAADIQKAAATLALGRAKDKLRMDDERILKAVAVYFAKELNKLDAGTFTPLTAQSVKDGIKAEVDNV